MKALLLPISLGIAAAALLASCGGTQSNSDTISFSHKNAATTFRLVGSAADYEAEADLSFACTVDMLVPEHVLAGDAATLQDSIYKAAFDTTGVDLDDIIHDTFRRTTGELGYALADTTIADSSYDGLYTIEGTVESLTSKLMSYAVTVSEYMPRAAHGMYATTFVNYDLVEGKVFTLNDIFTAEGLEHLPALLRRTAQSLRANIGSTDLTELPSGGNFCINSYGEIVFVYAPYEIASYAQGEIHIPVPAYIVAEYLTPYGTNLLME